MTGVTPGVLRRATARTLWLRCALLGALAAGVAPSARAALGDAEASVLADQARLNGAHRLLHTAANAVRLHEITTADGSSIREYVSAQGVVFAVGWSTHFKPDLAALLGGLAPTYAAAARDALRTPGIKRHVALQRGDLVVHSSTHLNVFVGQAYVPSLVPPEVSVDALH